MNFTRKKIIIIMMIISVLSLFCIWILKNNDVVGELPKTDKIEIIQHEKEFKEIEFLKSISGVKAQEVEIISEPVGIKGSFVVPKRAILNGLRYFLENTKNDTMDNIKLEIGEGDVTIGVDYKITNSIVTPIEVKVSPALSQSNDLILNIKDVKFLDLKISKWLVDIALKSFIKDWFPENGDLNIAFEDGVVVVYKDNFKGLHLDSIKVEPSGLNIGMTIDLNSIFNRKNNR